MLANIRGPDPVINVRHLLHTRKFVFNMNGNRNIMNNFFTRLLMSKVIVLFFVSTALWGETASAAQPVKLGSAETVSGGELIFVKEPCIFQGLGTGYALYLTNPRGSIIGKGCALTGALPPELGMFMVQWGSSPVRGAESYQIDDFKWTKRGRAVMAPMLKERHDALVRMKAKEVESAKENAAETAMVLEFNNPESEKTYLGVVRSDTSPDAILIIPTQCSLTVTEPDPTGKYSGVMVRKDNGRTALELSSDGNSVVDKGCASPNSGGGITIQLGYDSPVSFAAENISWEPKGQEWMGAETEKGH